MREKINLTSKILGMISIVAGVTLFVYFIVTVVQFFVAAPMPNGGRPRPESFTDMLAYVIFHVSLNYILACVIHILIGWYLLLDNNLLVRLAIGGSNKRTVRSVAVEAPYPQNTQHEKQSDDKAVDVQKDYSDYAPKS